MTFTYDEDLAIDSVNDILTDLIYADLTHLDELAEVAREAGGINSADIEEEYPDAYECWESIQSEVYDRLTTNNIIPEDFFQIMGVQADELGDYVDEQVEIMLSYHLEITELLAA